MLRKVRSSKLLLLALSPNDSVAVIVPVLSRTTIPETRHINVLGFPSIDATRETPLLYV